MEEDVKMNPKVLDYSGFAFANILFVVGAGIFFTCIDILPVDYAMLLMCAVALIIIMLALVLTIRSMKRVFRGITLKYVKSAILCILIYWLAIGVQTAIASHILMENLLVCTFLLMGAVLVIDQSRRWKFLKMLKCNYPKIHNQYCRMDVWGNKRYRYLKQEMEKILEVTTDQEIKDCIVREKSCYAITFLCFETACITSIFLAMIPGKII